MQRTATEEVHLRFREAAAKGDLVTCQRLSKNNSLNINAKGQPSGKTALHQAVIYNQVPIVEFLLSFNNIEHEKDASHRTPMDYARENDAHQIVQLLIERFPHIIPAISPSDLCHKYGQTYVSYIQNNARTMTIDQAIQLSDKIPPGFLYMGTSLLMQIALNSHNWDVMRQLIKLGEDPNVQVAPCQLASYWDTPLHMFLANEDPAAIQFVDLSFRGRK